jgi:hypothetical protein
VIVGIRDLSYEAIRTVEKLAVALPGVPLLAPDEGTLVTFARRGLPARDEAGVATRRDRRTGSCRRGAYRRHEPFHPVYATARGSKRAGL